jgi:hypothetical protein
MALEKDPLKATEQLEKLSEASLAFIKEALTLEETGNQISVRQNKISTSLKKYSVTHHF